MKTTKTNFNRMNPIGLAHVKIIDSFWSPWQKLVKDSIIPYQWDALNDQIPGAEPSRIIKNFEIAANRTEALWYGVSG